MRDRIQKLCKRLKRFTLEEIALIAELDESEIEKFLKELIRENFLKKQNDTYLYLENKKALKNHLPIMFQCHSPEKISILIKCFCAEIPSTKTSLISGLSENCSCAFNKFFRQVIYERQKQELIKYFEVQPQLARLRNFFNKNFYFYYYDNRLYVSNELLKNKNAQVFSENEIKKFKIIYSMLCRKLTLNTLKHYTNLHLAEQIWRYGKDFFQLEKELKFLLFN